ncbi:helix-turn-helix domain-containing protein [Fluviicola sp.]|uniref:TetR/AcrR family transcriptional regulator n=1 Tax=Fluviicola sp. TaxID=1917219 RepID=UPI0031E28537
MIIQFKIAQPASTYLRDPQETKLGLSIITHSINLIHEIGFERFTLKKLSDSIGCTEASIYRYFNSKQQLLLFLFSWYWGMMNYRIQHEINQSESAVKQLQQAIILLIERRKTPKDLPVIDELKLQDIIEQEGVKSLLTKDVDNMNKTGAFENYKQLVGYLVQLVHQINPQYAYPNMLITTIIEGAHLQHFFADHLPRLTNANEDHQSVVSFYIHLLTSTLNAHENTDN